MIPTKRPTFNVNSIANGLAASVKTQNQHQAQIASQQKAATVAQNRATGGSRFNLRWSGSVPPNLSPDMVKQLLSPYVSFADIPAASGTVATNPAAGNSASQLKRGMTLNEVAGLLGQGKQISETVGDGGLKTQVYEYSTPNHHVQVTYVNGVVVQYTISSN